MGKEIKKEGLDELMEEKETKKKESKSKKTVKNEKQIAMDEFVENAKAKKSFTYKEIVDFMGEKNLTPEELDELYKELEIAGVEMATEEKESTLEPEPEEDDDDDDVKAGIIEKLATTGEASNSVAELDIEPNLEDISEIEKNRNI